MTRVGVGCRASPRTAPRPQLPARIWWGGCCTGHTTTQNPAPVPAAIDALDRNLSWSKTASFLFLLFLPAPIASDQYTLCFGIIAARRQHESSSANLRSAHFCSPTFLRSKPCSPRNPADSAPNQRGPPPPSPPCLAIAHPPTCPILTQVWTRAAPGDQQTCLWTQTSLLLFPQQLPARPPQFELEQHPSLTATA